VLLFAALLTGLGAAAVPKGGDRTDQVPPPAERQQVAKAAAIDPPKTAKVDEPKRAEPIEFRDPGLVLYAGIQTELKLTDEQVRQIGDIVQQVHDQAKNDDAVIKPIPFGQASVAVAADRRPGSPAEQDANKHYVQKGYKALQKALPEILTYRQGLRLRQLERQFAGSLSFQDLEDAKLLGLTEDQRAKVQTIVKKAFERIPIVQDEQMIAHNAAHKAAFQQVLALLTEDQRKTWDELVGEIVDVESLREAEFFTPPRLRPMDMRVGGLRKSPSD
jgi:hypothetical protein